MKPPAVHDIGQIGKEPIEFFSSLKDKNRKKTITRNFIGIINLLLQNT